MTASAALRPAAFATLLAVACLMGANHVAARLAFDAGAGVVTAVLCRSAVTALVLAVMLVLWRVPLTFTPRQRRALPVIGLLIGVQSLCLYAAVARVPVALALLAFNTYPLWTALWARVVYGQRPEPRVLRAMPVLLVGLALALDVSGVASGAGLSGHWAAIGTGIGFAMLAAAAFGGALVLTQQATGGLDGRLRSACTLSIVALLAGAVLSAQGGPAWPQSLAGWWGLAGLTVLYGTAFTVMFTVLPRLGVVGNSAIMNVEPVFALVLAWAVLGQAMAAVQVAGALLVVATVMWLGLRRSP